MIDFLKKAKSFLKAFFGPKASIETYVSRLNTCLSCSWNIKKENNNYCRECGCPKTKLWPFSELRTKSRYLNTECPRKKWK